MAVGATGRDGALKRDARDSLAAFRARFYVRPDTIYFDGNSLGLASRDAEAAVLAARSPGTTSSSG